MIENLIKKSCDLLSNNSKDSNLDDEEAFLRHLDKESKRRRCNLEKEIKEITSTAQFDAFTLNKIVSNGVEI